MTAVGPVLLGTVTLPGAKRSVGEARSFVRNLLVDAESVADDLVTVVSETVCNAITHTESGEENGQVTVTLTAGDGAYRLEVTDDGAGGARPYIEEETGAERGRGMRIVDALAHRWGYRAAGERTVVWAEFPCAGGFGPGGPPGPGNRVCPSSPVTCRTALDADEPEETPTDELTRPNSAAT